MSPRLQRIVARFCWPLTEEQKSQAAGLCSEALANRRFCDAITCLTMTIAEFVADGDPHLMKAIIEDDPAMVETLADSLQLSDGNEVAEINAKIYEKWVSSGLPPAGLLGGALVALYNIERIMNREDRIVTKNRGEA